MKQPKYPPQIAQAFKFSPGNWLPECPVRLTVKIPTHDRKLVPYMRWLRKNDSTYRPDDPDKAFAALMNRWWVYFGTIPPDKIIAGLK